MPTSKARKGRIVARLKQKEKIALEKKSKLGLKKSRWTQRTAKKGPDALNKVVSYLRYTFDDIFPKETAANDSANNLSMEPRENFERKFTLYEDNGEVFDAVFGNDRGVKREEVEKHETEITIDRNEDATPLLQCENASKCLSEKSKTANHYEIHTPNKGDSWQYSIFNFRALPFRIWNVFSRVFKPFTSSDELIDLKRRIMLLEQDVAKLRNLLEGPRPQIPSNRESITAELTNALDIPVSTPAALPPPPPPLLPPPPPPPPPPPAPPSMQLCSANLSKRQNLKRKSASSDAANKGKSSSALHITSEQLCKVKLKSVSFNNEIGKEAPTKRGQLVTLKDLQTIKLRKTSNVIGNCEGMQAITERTPLKDVANLKVRDADKENKVHSSKVSTPHCVYNLRKSLRKVNFARSPGGTPLVKMKRETGVGLTPLLTAALKRKFKNANQGSLENSPDF